MLKDVGDMIEVLAGWSAAILIGWTFGSTPTAQISDTDENEAPTSEFFVQPTTTV